MLELHHSNVEPGAIGLSGLSQSPFKVENFEVRLQEKMKRIFFFSGQRGFCRGLSSGPRVPRLFPDLRSSQCGTRIWGVPAYRGDHILHFSSVRTFDADWFNNFLHWASPLGSGSARSGEWRAARLCFLPFIFSACGLPWTVRLGSRNDRESLYGAFQTNHS